MQGVARSCNTERHSYRETERQRYVRRDLIEATELVYYVHQNNSCKLSVCVSRLVRDLSVSRVCPTACASRLACAPCGGGRRRAAASRARRRCRGAAVLWELQHETSSALSVGGSIWSSPYSCVYSCWCGLSLVNSLGIRLFRLAAESRHAIDVVTARSSEHPSLRRCALR